MLRLGNSTRRKVANEAHATELLGYATVGTTGSDLPWPTRACDGHWAHMSKTHQFCSQ